ncbi:hypothetical protein Clacol_003828 [Clathrus columnatus]|uniref:Uncharacterized protein n=1 Tax=Clathrus columnatus TaxID=1419009 RepID=A0AAV5A9J9_9AGAM|nr:hypothetical protein Clacol_003828 [Clathrus columnatus]
MRIRTSRIFIHKPSSVVIRKVFRSLTYNSSTYALVSRHHPDLPTSVSAEEPEHTPKSISFPSNVSQLALKLEQTLEGNLFPRFPEVYTSFRLLALSYARNTRIPTTPPTTLFTSPNNFYDKARTRLCQNPSKEYAALHDMMYNDAFVIFGDNLPLEHPLVFAIELFEFLLNRNAIHTAQNTFEHIGHLVDIYPTDFSTVLSPERMDNWIKSLLSNSDSNAISLLQHMVFSLPRYVRIQPNRRHHHHVLKALLQANQPGRAWCWLETMQFQNHTSAERGKRHWWTKLSHLPWFNSEGSIPQSSSIEWITTQTQDYDLFLTYFAKRGDFLSTQLVIKQMFILGAPVLPGWRSWHLYLLAAVSCSKPSIATVSAVIMAMSKTRVNLSLSTLQLLSGRGELGSWIPNDILFLLRSAESVTKTETTQEILRDLLPEIKSEPMNIEAQNNIEVKLPPHLKQVSPNEHMVSNSPVDLYSFQLDATKEGPLVDIFPSGEEFGLLHDSSESSAAFEKTENLNLDSAASTNSANVPPIEEALSESFQMHKDVDIEKHRRSLLKMAETPNTVNTMRSFNAYIDLPGARRLDIELGSALVRGLCRNVLKAASKRNVFQAVKAYRDLLATNLDPNTPSFFSHSSEQMKIDPTKEWKYIFYTLLRNLTAQSPASSSRAEALETQERCVADMLFLLTEMKNRSVPLDPRLIAPIVLLRWRSIGSHKDAFQYYTSFIAEIEPSTSPDAAMNSDIMDISSFRSILNTFGQLSFPSAPVTPARLWCALLSHMRARGYTPTNKDYTLYLSNIISKRVSPLSLRYTTLGMDPPEEEEILIKSMHDSLKFLHRQITIDINFTPDAMLLNNLMNGFQRVGAFDDALKVFNLSWLTGKIDIVTPNIMFDACGHAKRPFEAYVIWNMLIRRGWKFDKRTLDTWVECLCRLGYVDQACSFVCLYMGKDHGKYETIGDTKPDVNTCLIVLKLSWNVGQSLQVKEKLKSHLPHIWNELSAKYM